MKPGDVVRLKAGGPNMTVELVINAPAPRMYPGGPVYQVGIYCVWFTTDSKLKRGTFPEKFLQAA
jgi:uncharacterized protein YodC (DUF2158 family)